MSLCFAFLNRKICNKNENMLVYIIVAFAVSCVFTALLMPYVIKFCEFKKLYDRPDERKIHHSAIPRLGGVLFMPAMLTGMIAAFVLFIFLKRTQFMLQASSFVLIAGVFLMYIIGVIDDLIGVRANRKFVVQTVAACFFPICGLCLNNLYGFLGIYEIPYVVSYPLTVFLVITIVNSINLIDGIDGLASGLCIMIFFVFIKLFSEGNPSVYALMASALMGSLIAFFYFNFFGKAKKGTKIFMGDTGSLILGYSIAYLALKYAMNNPAVFPYRHEALLWPYTVLIVPTFDVARVTIGRIVRRVPVFGADKTHIHHVIMQTGFSMHQTLGIILSLFVFYCLLNSFLFDICGSYNLIVIVDVLSYAGFFALLHAVKGENCKASGMAGKSEGNISGKTAGKQHVEATCAHDNQDSCRRIGGRR